MQITVEGNQPVRGTGFGLPSLPKTLLPLRGFDVRLAVYLNGALEPKFGFLTLGLSVGDDAKFRARFHIDGSSFEGLFGKFRADVDLLLSLAVRDGTFRHFHMPLKDVQWGFEATTDENMAIVSLMATVREVRPLEGTERLDPRAFEATLDDLKEGR